MKKIISAMRNIAKGNIKGTPILPLIFLIVLMSGILCLIPLSLILGLRMMGMPVVVSFSSWIGSIIIMVFIRISVGKKTE